MTAPLKILVMAGGTGGHVYPALAVARELQRRGHEVEWVGTRHGMESEVVTAANIPLHYLAVRGVRGKNLGQTLGGLLRLAVSCFQALALVWRSKPDVVMGMGGYAAGPAGAAAWVLRKPLLIHEQNAVAGTTNRLLAPLARRVVAGFEGAFSGRSDVTVVGNPVRAELIDRAASTSWTYDRTRPMRLLVLGGSLGAKAINDVLPLALGQLEGIQVRHQTGTAHAEAVRAAYAQVGVTDVSVEPFIQDMASAYGWADLVVCRAGALTVAELAVMGRPAVLVPLPHAIDNHQYWNARSLSDVGAGRLLEQKDLSPDSLVSVLTQLQKDPAEMAAMATAARVVARPDAAGTVADCCEELAHA